MIFSIRASVLKNVLYNQQAAVLWDAGSKDNYPGERITVAPFAAGRPFLMHVACVIFSGRQTPGSKLVIYRLPLQHALRLS
jgi:hypothetical protein